MIVDYYLVKNQDVDIDQMFNADPSGHYYYDNGWNMKAIITMVLAGIFSVATVWHPSLASLSGFAWVIGALLGGGIYRILMR